MTSMHSCGSACQQEPVHPRTYLDARSVVQWHLKPEIFEGLRFDFTKPLNQNFALCHRYAHHLVRAQKWLWTMERP